MIEANKLKMKFIKGFIIGGGIPIATLLTYPNISTIHLLIICNLSVLIAIPYLYHSIKKLVING